MATRTNGPRTTEKGKDAPQTAPHLSIINILGYPGHKYKYKYLIYNTFHLSIINILEYPGHKYKYKHLTPPAIYPL